MKTSENHRMTSTASVSLRLPVSLWRSVHTTTVSQGLSIHEASERLIAGLSGFTDTDLRSMPEPPKEIKSRALALSLDWKYLDRLSELSRTSSLTVYSIFRRILHAILVARTICFVLRENENGLSLRISQIHGEFEVDLACKRPIRPQADSIGRNHDSF